MRNLKLQELEETLTAALHLKAPEFRLEKSGKRISGSIVSESFRGMDDAKRQKWIWDALDKRYQAESTHFVGMLLAFTPEEWNVQLEGHSNGHGKSRGRSTRKV